jgi:lincosamide nucleotidyltransferase A/C/D/E
MDAHTAAETIELLEKAGLEIYVDGGWAVDALLGEQTRPHDDLDIAIPHSQVPALRGLLGELEYCDHPRPDSRECNFVLRDPCDRRLDVHSFELDRDGNSAFGIPYKRDDLQGRGMINGYGVKCISPRSLVRFHTGYEVDENDYHDVCLICERFRISLPDDYRTRLAGNRSGSRPREDHLRQQLKPPTAPVQCFK